MEDKRSVLKEEKPFAYQILKDKKAIIFWKGKKVMIIKDKECSKLQEIIGKGDEYQIQMFLAKTTGHFKH